MRSASASPRPVPRPWAVLVLVLALAALLLSSGCAVFRPAPPTAGKAPRGTQKPYTIRGVTYYPLSSAGNYVEEGLASWYGPDFHGNPTSCGELYDMYKMTAAHKVLPMHTMLVVTNLENGRTVTVRVNDRGPFVSGRVIDMSLAGAKELGFHGKGTARVRLETLGAIPGATPEKGLPGPFYVQIGAFVEKGNADRLLARIRRSGYAGSRINDAYVGGDRFYRVHAGAFPDLAAAGVALERLADLYPGAFIVAE